MQSFSLPSKPTPVKAAPVTPGPAKLVHDNPSFLKPAAQKPMAATSRIAEQLGELQQSAMNLALPMSAHVRRSTNVTPSSSEKPRPVNPFEATVKTLGTSVIEKNEDRFTQAAQELLSKQQSGEQTLFQEAIKKAQQEANKEREELFRKANVSATSPLSFSQPSQGASSSHGGGGGGTTDVFEKLNALKKQLEQENSGIQSKVQQGNAKISQSMSGLADQAALAGQLKDQLLKWERVSAQVDTFTNTTDKLANIGEMFKDGLQTMHSLGLEEDDGRIDRFPHASFLDLTTINWSRQSEKQRSLKENKVVISQTQNGFDSVDVASDQNIKYWLGSSLNKQINKVSVKVMKIGAGSSVENTFVFPTESYAKRIMVVQDLVYVLSSMKDKNTMTSSLTRLKKSDLSIDESFGSSGTMYFTSDLFENSMSIQMALNSNQTQMVVLARATLKTDSSIKSVITFVSLEKGTIDTSVVLEGDGEVMVTDLCFTLETTLVMVGIELLNNVSKPLVMQITEAKEASVTKQYLPTEFFPKKVMETKDDYKVLVQSETNGLVLSLDKISLAVQTSTSLLPKAPYIKTVPENWFFNSENKMTIVGSIQKTDSKTSSDSFVCLFTEDLKPIHLGNNFYQSINAVTQLADGKMIYNGITDQTSSSQSRVGLLFEMK